MDKLHRQLGALRTFWGVESCKGNTAWVTVSIIPCKAEMTYVSIRNSKFGHRCSKIGTNDEKAIREGLLIREDTGKKKGRGSRWIVKNKHEKMERRERKRNQSHINKLLVSTFL